MKTSANCGGGTAVAMWNKETELHTSSPFVTISEYTGSVLKDQRSLSALAGTAHPQGVRMASPQSASPGQPSSVTTTVAN